MRFLDLFAGIGGFRMGMEQAGHECVGYVEVDKFARKSYEAIYDTEGEWTAHDITEVTNEEWRELQGAVDVITGGFPCQSFSVAGKRGGFSDTRGTLFFEIARATEQIKPRILLLENVKGLLSHDKGKTFATILSTLDELGYDAEWQVLNSKDFGVPQNRERVFIIGHLRGTSGREVFPIGGENTNSLELAGMLDIKGNESIRRVYKTGGISPSLTTMQGGNREPKILDDQGRTKKKNKLKDISPTLRRESHGNETKVVMPVLTPDRLNKRQNGRRFKDNGEPSFTLTSQDRHGVMIEQVKEIAKKTRPNEEIAVSIKENGDIRPHRMDKRKSGLSELNINYDQNESHTVTAAHSPKVYGDSTEYRIRKLTPKECWRLQGFPDWAFEKAAEVNSDSQLYKQAGNAVTVNVIYEIAKRLEV